MVHHYLARLDPDGTEPDPTEQRDPVDDPARRRQPVGPVRTRRGGRGEGAGRGGVDRAGRPARRGHSHPRPAAGRRARPAGRQRPGRREPAVPAHGQAARRGHRRPRRPGRPAHRARRGPHRVRGDRSPPPGPAGWPATAASPAIVFGPDGQLLDMGRDKRLFPPHIRRALDVRDRGCVFAGCDAPTWWCDAHHVLHWIDGGETSLENGALLCERHHTKVHHGFRIERQPDGRWRTYRPDGTEILMPDRPATGERCPPAAVGVVPGRYGVARAADRRRPPARPCPAVPDAGRAHRQRHLPGRAAGADPDAGLRGHPRPRRRRGADPDAGHRRRPATGWPPRR